MSMADSKIERSISLVRQKKFATLLKIAIKSTIPRKLLYFDMLYIVGVSSVDTKKLRTKNLSSRMASLSDIKKLSQIYGDSEVFRKRFENGCECMIAEIKGEIAGAIWLQYNDTYRTNCEYIYRPESKLVWIFDAFIVPKYRLRGVFPFLISEIINYVNANAHEGVCGEIHYENQVSINAHLKIGFRKIEKISYVSFLGFFIYLVKNCALKRNRYLFRYVNPMKSLNNAR